MLLFTIRGLHILQQKKEVYGEKIQHPHQIWKRNAHRNDDHAFFRGIVMGVLRH